MNITVTAIPKDMSFQIVTETVQFVAGIYYLMVTADEQTRTTQYQADDDASVQITRDQEKFLRAHLLDRYKSINRSAPTDGKLIVCISDGPLPSIASAANSSDSLAANSGYANNAGKSPDN
ncbi:hypothetical protein [Pseudomonas wadenswilerensis]|uniref:hypothetical protein n=1 Tax=Pseudomonas wadenswilerensis TaxID=1785161 RepID=UPI0021601512|nr:hypothetical protein [Pseudomonas wadenswilerensis]UVM24153.1 hypothetical protein LOY45_11540 [Pseudomonas wadenswilerensis]